MKFTKYLPSLDGTDHITAKALKLLPYYKTYRNEYKLIQESESWDREQIEHYQLKQLNDLLDHAYHNVPYYRRVFNERGLTPADIQSLDDLQKLPLLTKEDVRENIEDLKATNYSEEDFEYVKTGGSTGKPLEFCYESGVTRAKEWAYMKTQWERVGYSFRDKCVVLRGEEVSSDESQFWDTTFFGRWLVLSSYHMNDDRLPKYISKIREFEPKYIQAYPSVISIFARYMDENDVTPFSSVEAVLCGSEKLYPNQRKQIENALGCRVYSWYGHAERCVLAGECELNRQRYHVFPQYGMMELINGEGDLIGKKKTKGEIVGTSFNNYAMPLIRYRTNDIGKIDTTRCDCGRSYTVLESVEGRVQEMFVDDTGRSVPLTGLHSRIGKSSQNIKNAQFYQEEEGEVALRIVSTDEYDRSDTSQIISTLSNRYDNIQFNIEFVNEIDRTQSGKKRFLIQELSTDYGEE
jgi:phenylacetate-CoA ligase